MKVYAFKGNESGRHFLRTYIFEAISSLDDPTLSIEGDLFIDRYSGNNMLPFEISWERISEKARENLMNREITFLLGDVVRDEERDTIIRKDKIRKLLSYQARSQNGWDSILNIIEGAKNSVNGFVNMIPGPEAEELISHLKPYKG